MGNAMIRQDYQDCIPRSLATALFADNPAVFILHRAQAALFAAWAWRGR